MADNKDFKDGLKATSLFGGVQIYNILINIIRSKLVAILLGPEGMGFNGILQSTVQLINSFSGFGLGTSAVKNVSEAYAADNHAKLSYTISVFRKLVLLTGLFGMVLCVLLSPILSLVSFGNYNYIYAFIAISVSVLFMQFALGQRALLQGTKRFRYMAMASFLGSTIGLITTIPLYYLFGIDGVVPAIIISSITTFLLMWYYSRKVYYDKTILSFKTALVQGNDMIKTGFFISVQSILSFLMVYVLRVFINRYGGLADVGLFVAGFAIVDTYVGMVFSSMSTEYYPRLASRCNGTLDEFNETINQQIKISLLLVSPMVCSFLVFGNLAVSLLYSDKFLPITLMICFAILGTFLKAPSWCIAYSFLSKGDGLWFCYSEVMATLYQSFLQMFFFYYWGLTGIGVAYLLTYFIYTIQVYVMCRYRYKYSIDMSILYFFVPQITLGIICFLMFIYFSPIYRYTLGFLVSCISGYMSYRMLNNYINVNQIIMKYFKR